MRIAFHKISAERHALEIERAGLKERVMCETRSYLVHDLLHYAVESEAGLEGGFWGHLANGKTLAEMNDRTGKALAGQAPELPMIELLVGALSSAVKGRSAQELAAGLGNYAEANGIALPEYLSERFIEAVQERMRHLQGHWGATKFGAAMELPWPADEPADDQRRK